MSAANLEEIVALLGDVDELIVERLVNTGASVDEIGEALDALEDEQRFGEEPRLDSSPRVTEARAILEELFAEDEHEDDGPGPSLHGA
jgi:hypothetical protein